MWQFLTFEKFISQDVLIFFYYMFALMMPIFLWSMRFYILKKIPYLKRINHNTIEVYKNLDIKKKVFIVLVFIMMFFCMELCLRMMFEMIIGYFDMHNYLQILSTQ
jgi:hypothetical protein